MKKITSSKEANNAPSGFGSFSLLHDGNLLEDHYLSATRFKNIVKKEL
ncbi:MAG: YoaP domain-containing protein [Candidatus Tenebribacter mawsonii]|nr:YoaP domain-containing protein [Candidatus Tenebribacter mawsonii]